MSNTTGKTTFAHAINKGKVLKIIESSLEAETIKMKLLRWIKEPDMLNLALYHEKGNSFNTQTGSHNKLTPLIYAIHLGNPSVVEFLLEHGANANYAANSESNTPLSFALTKGSVEICEILLKHDAHVMKNPTQLGKLFVDIVYYASCDVVEFALKQGFASHINYQSSFGETPIMTAVQSSRKDITMLLLQYGADPHMEDYNESILRSDKILQPAIEMMEDGEEHGDTTSIKFMTRLRRQNRMNALDHARECGNQEIASILESYMGG